MNYITLPLVGAGFPSPAESFFERRLSLTDLLVPHPDFTYFVRVQGSSMSGISIFDGDILVVDRSLPPSNNAIMVVVLNGGLLVKRVQYREDGTILLLAEHPQYPPIVCTSNDHIILWGRVTYVLHKIDLAPPSSSMYELSHGTQQ